MQGNVLEAIRKRDFVDGDSGTSVMKDLPSSQHWPIIRTRTTTKGY